MKDCFILNERLAIEKDELLDEFQHIDYLNLFFLKLKLFRQSVCV